MPPSPAPRQAQPSLGAQPPLSLYAIPVFHSFNSLRRQPSETSLSSFNIAIPTTQHNTTHPNSYPRVTAPTHSWTFTIRRVRGPEYSSTLGLDRSPSHFTEPFQVLFQYLGITKAPGGALTAFILLRSIIASTVLLITTPYGFTDSTSKNDDSIPTPRCPTRHLLPNRRHKHPRAP
jgi:hypothetical protein